MNCYPLYMHAPGTMAEGSFSFELESRKAPLVVLASHSVHLSCFPWTALWTVTGDHRIAAAHPVPTQIGPLHCN